MPVVPDVLSTIGPGAGEDWSDHVEWFPPPTSNRALVGWLAGFARRARGRTAVVLRGTSGSSELYRDLLAAAVVGRMRGGPRVVVSDATIELGSRSLRARFPWLPESFGRRLSRVLVTLADSPRTTWCVLSTEELQTFPRAWRVPAERVLFTPFSSTVWERPEATDPALPVPGSYVFSGGNSLRSYDLLLNAVEGTGIPVVIATAWRPQRELPTSVTVERVSHGRFMALMAGARAVVLPLEVASRSTGQQTYLNAMWFERPVVVTEAPGVRDHVEDGVTGVVVPADAAALRVALSDVFQPSRSSHYAEMGRRARAAVDERFRDEHYRRRLLQVAGVLSDNAPVGS